MGINLKDELPTEKENFLAEVEVMDLSNIRDKKFAVAVATGDPKKCKFLCSTIHGPYDFVEMLQEVGSMWQVDQQHAKVIVLNKQMKTKVEMLNEDTIDYIECHYIDVITEEMLGGAFDDKEFTCKAGTILEEEDAAK